MSEAFNASRQEEPTQRCHIGGCIGEYGISLSEGTWHKFTIPKTARHPAWSALPFGSTGILPVKEYEHLARFDGVRASCP